MGITPQRSGRASTLRGVEREGPGRAIACCESGVVSVTWKQNKNFLLEEMLVISSKLLQ